MIDYYILVGKTPILVELEEWAHWFETNMKTRVLAQTKVGEDNVSTVFIGIDMNYDGYGPPVVFETMVFPDCDIQYRYASYDDAMEGHWQTAKMLRLGVMTKALKKARKVKK